MRPAGMGRSRVRDILRSISRSNHMLIALAPPAIKYPAMATVSTSWNDGRPRPATNMGAIVVTRSSEMMRGLVSVTRSVARDGRRPASA
jgi:DNA polymerase III psi subunit